MGLGHAVVFLQPGVIFHGRCRRAAIQVPICAAGSRYNVPLTPRSSLSPLLPQQILEVGKSPGANRHPWRGGGNLSLDTSQGRGDLNRVGRRGPEQLSTHPPGEAWSQVAPPPPHWARPSSGSFMNTASNRRPRCATTAMPCRQSIPSRVVPRALTSCWPPSTGIDRVLSHQHQQRWGVVILPDVRGLHHFYEDGPPPCGAWL